MRHPQRVAERAHSMKPSSLLSRFIRLTAMEQIIETESLTGRLLARRSVRLVLIWGVWTLVGLFFTGQVLVYGVYMEKRPPLSYVMFMQISICYLWALTTPLVL